MKEDLPQRGASAGHERKQLVAWLEHHRDTLKDSSARLLSAPFSTLLTVLVLAVAMALPAGLYVLLDNVRRVTEGMESASQITLYLKESLPPQRQELLLKQLNQDSRFGQIQLISSDQALQEFREYSGWGDVLDYLDTNPLPAVVVVRPLMTDTQPDEMERWLDDLRRLPDVESVQLDMQWVRRLYSLYDLLERGVAALALLLGVAMALIVGNTIRLAIENRREEIVVVKLVGGTDAYVRRPFLYTGFWYGLASALLAWNMVGILLVWISEPVGRLTELYASQFELRGLAFGDGLLLLMLGAGMGIGGAWLAVRRHLSAIEPA
ncbi:MAG: cell division protein FtsX [Hahellaceae bacterium]|nr:cell division protein FtsX [Hahellaceae bacterium]